MGIIFLLVYWKFDQYTFFFFPSESATDFLNFFELFMLISFPYAYELKDMFLIS